MASSMPWQFTKKSQDCTNVRSHLENIFTNTMVQTIHPQQIPTPAQFSPGWANITCIQWKQWTYRHCTNNLLTVVSFHTMNHQKKAGCAMLHDRIAAPSHVRSSCLACIEAAVAMSGPPVALICCWWYSCRSLSISSLSASWWAALHILGEFKQIASMVYLSRETVRRLSWGLFISPVK